MADEDSNIDVFAGGYVEKSELDDIDAYDIENYVFEKPMDDNDAESVNMYFEAVKNFPILSAEKMDELCKQAQNGNMLAREQLINSNLRLCYFIARKYINSGVPFDDLVQEGCHGLMKAVDKFDPTKGAKFSTYAVIWIKGKILKAINRQSSDMRVPENVYADYRTIQKVADALSKELGRIPTSKEVSVASGFCEKKINKIKLSIKSIVSIDTTVYDDDGATLGNTIPDESDHSFSDIENKSIVDEALMVLTEQEKYVICCFGGFNGYPVMTTVQIAESIKPKKLSASRVHQIKRRALNKLRLEGKNDFLQLFYKTN